LHPAVSRIFNPQAAGKFVSHSHPRALPIGNRRYGRFQICATKKFRRAPGYSSAFHSNSRTHPITVSSDAQQDAEDGEDFLPVAPLAEQHRPSLHSGRFFALSIRTDRTMIDP